MLLLLGIIISDKWFICWNVFRWQSSQVLQSSNKTMFFSGNWLEVNKESGNEDAWMFSLFFLLEDAWLLHTVLHKAGESDITLSCLKCKTLMQTIKKVLFFEKNKRLLKISVAMAIWMCQTYQFHGIIWYKQETEYHACFHLTSMHANLIDEYESSIGSWKMTINPKQQGV